MSPLKAQMSPFAFFFCITQISSNFYNILLSMNCEKNILSYQAPAYFSGFEIRNWCFTQIHNNTSHSHMAHKIIERYKMLQDDAKYQIVILKDRHGRKYPKLYRIKDF